MKRHPRQLTLLGDGFVLPMARCGALPLASLPVQDGLPPDAAFVDSIARFGVIEPVIVVAARGRMLLAGGRRRVCAARLCGLTEVPAQVYDFDDTVTDAAGSVAGDAVCDGPDLTAQLDLIAATLTMLLNAQRRDNALADVRAIARLRAQGASDRDIRQATGMSVGRIRRRERLLQLDDVLQQALGQGRIGVQVAEACAALPAPIQAALRDRYRASGRLSTADVTEAQSVRLRQAQHTLVLGGFDAVLHATPTAVALASQAVPALDVPHAPEPVGGTQADLYAMTGAGDDVVAHDVADAVVNTVVNDIATAIAHAVVAVTAPAVALLVADALPRDARLDAVRSALRTAAAGWSVTPSASWPTAQSVQAPLPLAALMAVPVPA